jgi:MarR family transcriptional regulator, negative regulator of the multidrug operon emrRAB
VGADRRTANLLGALAVVLGDRVETAIRAAGGLSAREAAALVTLRNYAEREPLSVLERALGLSQPGAVRLVDRLAARGLVQRRRDGSDRREVRLSLTPAGRAAADTALRGRTAALEALLGSLAPADRRALEPVLEGLLGAATASRADARSTCRLCDAVACGHPARCPVTRAADAAAI